MSQTQKAKLLVDFCSYEAAKWAVEHWHYSKTMPRSKMNTIGAWEDNNFIGAIVFSYGATPQIGSPYGLKQTEIVELTRVALTLHQTPVSKILSLAIKILNKLNPDLRLIVSFADMEQLHYGTIYQATNWIYAGTTTPGRVGFVVNRKKVHTRTIGSKPGGVQSLEWVKAHLDRGATEWIGTIKHRYLYPLDRAMRKQIEPLSKPYPKRDMRPADGGNLATSEAGRFDSDQAAFIDTGQQPVKVT